MLLPLSTIAVSTRAGSATVRLSAARSKRRHQMQGRRADAFSPAAVARDKPQACELGRRVDLASFPQIQIGGFLPRRLVVARAFASEPIITNSANVKACRPRVRQSLDHQQPVNVSADRPHLNRLSSSLTCCINKCQQPRTNSCLSHPKKSRVK